MVFVGIVLLQYFLTCQHIVLLLKKNLFCFVFSISFISFPISQTSLVVWCKVTPHFCSCFKLFVCLFVFVFYSSWAEGDTLISTGCSRVNQIFAFQNYTPMILKAVQYLTLHMTVLLLLLITHKQASVQTLSCCYYCQYPCRVSYSCLSRTC